MLMRAHPFTNGRLVDLNSLDASFLKIDDLVTKRKGQLLGLNFSRDVHAGERPVQNGDRAGKHALHRLLREALGVAAPFDGHRTRATYIGNDNRGTNIAIEVCEL